MVCCSFCGLDLSYLPHGASVVNSVFPLPAKFRHPLEVSRFKLVTSLSDISFLVHRAIELSLPLDMVSDKVIETVSDTVTASGKNLMESDSNLSNSSVSEAFSALAPFSQSHFKHSGNYEQPSLTLGGTFSNPQFIVHDNRARLLAEDEVNFIAGTLLFSLYGGFFPYCLLAQFIEAGRIKVLPEVERTVGKWFESYWYSADRFSALLFKKPGLWLRAFLKLYTLKVDLVSLIDVNLKHFPSNPGKVASSLKGFPDLVRRLVELADFVKSEVYGRTSSNLIDSLAHVSTNQSHSYSESLADVDSSISISDSMVLPLPVGNTSSNSSSKGSCISIIYLSSFRNELIMLHPDMSVFQTIKLHDLCRHPRNITAIIEEDLFFISDFETSRIFAIDYKGNHLFDVGKSANLSHPSGMTVDDDLDLWVTDSWNNRLVRFSARSGYKESAVFLEGKCKRPLDICFDRLRGGFWVCDTGSSSILRMSDDGDILFSFGSEHLSLPDRIRMISGGGIFVSDSLKGALLSFEATGEYLGNISRGSLGRAVYLDSFDVSYSGEILLSEKGSNRMFFSSDSGASFKIIPVPVPNANEKGFPCAVMAIPDLIRRISGS
jgi:hypothetical protein